jgi:hypothetical protein
MIRYILAAAVAVAVGSPVSAFATACDVVGIWTANVDNGAYTIDIQMTTNKKGTSPDENPLCNNETSTIKTTKISKKVWNFSSSSKKCSEVETVASTFAKGSCTSASGTLTVPGYGSYPVTLTDESSTKRTPRRTPAALFNGLK